MTTSTRDPNRHGAKLYAAYGSNLSLSRMFARCRTAQRIGAGTIADYRLAFRNVATIIPEVGATVPVAVFSILHADEIALDQYEGFPGWYGKADVSVFLDSGLEVRAMTYTLDIGEIEPPGLGYLNVIREGYDDWRIARAPLNAAVARCRREVRAERTRAREALEAAPEPAPVRPEPAREPLERYKIRRVRRLRRGDVVRAIVESEDVDVVQIRAPLGRVRAARHRADGTSEVSFGEIGSRTAYASVYAGESIAVLEPAP
jgi:hypothetical protein